MTQHKILLLALAMGSVACDTVVDVDIPEEPARLVANSFLMADSAVVLQLTQSQSILSNASLQPVSGATAILLEDGQEVTTLEETNEPGIYRSGFIPTVGRDYTLRVSKTGYEPVEATTSVRPAVAIERIEVDTLVFVSTYPSGDSLITERNVTIDQARLTFSDPASERNYYEVIANRYQTYWEDVFDAQGEYVRTDTVRALTPIFLRSDDPALSGTSDEFTGGEDAAVYGEVLSFNDDFFNGKTYTFQFVPDYYSYYQSEENKDEIYVMLRSVDEGQYRYFRSVNLQYENDGNPFAEPVQVYSNVENGFGIVSGSSASQVTVSLE